MSIRVEHGDSRDVLKTLADASVDSVVTDPPYALVSIQKRFGKPGSAEAKDRDGLYKRASAGFMGQQWDTGETAFAAEFWAEVFRVLKPGGHLLAFSGTRTYHRMVCAIEDAGFEIRDQIGWLYGSGFPKSHDVSKGIDKAAGVEFSARPASGVGFMGPDGPGGYNVTKNQLSRVGESTDAARQWEGWGTALKPAWEPICMARKPLVGTVAANVLQHGTGALNIDGCRVAAVAGDEPLQWASPRGGIWSTDSQAQEKGRWPANVIHDGSEEVLAAFPQSESQRATVTSKPGAVYGNGAGLPSHTGIYGFDDSGSAARFFYSAKADASDRLGSKHPTVKPVDLMAYLCRLVTPPGGTVLDPFAGSGTTGMACMREGFNAILIEREAQFVADIKRRIDHVSGQDAPLFAEVAQ